MFLAVWENPYVTIFILRVKTCVKSSYYNVELLQKDQLQSLFEIFESLKIFDWPLAMSQSQSVRQKPEM